MWESPFTCLSCNVHLKFYPKFFVQYENFPLSSFSFLSIQWICILNVYYVLGTGDEWWIKCYLMIFKPSGTLQSARKYKTIILKQYGVDMCYLRKKWGSFLMESQERLRREVTFQLGLEWKIDVHWRGEVQGISGGKTTSNTQRIEEHE